MEKDLNRLLRWALLHLSIVAFLGLILRYKIAYSLPWLDQKNLQHAHSHFAFSAWVSLALLVLMAKSMIQSGISLRQSVMKVLLLIHISTAYGMLFAFAAQGYKFWAILFSTLNLFNFIATSFWYLKQLRSHKGRFFVSRSWFNASLVFGILSSAGTFYLVYMIASKTLQQEMYLASVYFYLHFQYNGFFLFALIGLILQMFNVHGKPTEAFKIPFLLLAGSAVPAFLLSVLWAKLPDGLYWLTVLATVVQSIGAVWLLFSLRKPFKSMELFHKPEGWLLLLSGFAFAVKTALQLGSVIPEVSKLAFGFRPVVIAYLHLIFLMLISLGIIALLIHQGIIPKTRMALISLFVFTFGVLANEGILLIQGIASFSYLLIPHLNEGLLLAAAMMFIGISLLSYQVLKGSQIQEN